jgi:hypothetical protein
MRKMVIAAAFLASVLSAAAPEPVTWKIQDAPTAPVKAGARFNVKLVAKMQDGFHVYSMKPIAEGPIPTKIWLASGQPFELAGSIKAPQAEVMQDSAFGMEVELYEGEAAFQLPLKVAPETPLGTQMLTVSVSYQSCNNKMCLPPKTVKVELEIPVVK